MMFARSKTKPLAVAYLCMYFACCILFHQTSSSVSAISSYPKKGVNGGVYCAACTTVAALINQMSVIYNETFVKSFDRLCKLLPEPMFRNACISLGNYYIPQIVDIISKEITADVICHAIDLCYTEKGHPTCRGFPPKGHFDFILNEAKKKILVAQVKAKVKLQKTSESPHFNPCALPGVRELCYLFKRVFEFHRPLVDDDDDYFSPSIQAWRGTSWRGRDCDDFNPDVHPGAIDKGDVILDSNCNGIWGIYDLKSLRTNEEVLCKDTGYQGLIVLGDSVAAHFHLPPQWLTASELKESVFDEAPFVIANEVDWPQLSLYTGYYNVSRWNLEKGNATSLYLKLFHRNHCNHRDYQNLAKNGADSFDVNNVLLKSLKRNKEKDRPALVIYSLVGNDVCNHWHDFDHMTTPEQMRANLLKTLEILDKRLPKESHVIVVGMVDGRVLYDNLHNRIHPIGKLRGDVTYAQFYDFLNCLEISPCYGWMNSNETVRNFTSDRAFALTAVMKDVVEKAKYESFDIFFLENPFHEVLQWHHRIVKNVVDPRDEVEWIRNFFDDEMAPTSVDWVAQGHEIWELIEPADGFHPRLIAESLTAEVAWRVLESKIPHVLGKINPNNDKIREMFGDQGGY